MTSSPISSSNPLKVVVVEDDPDIRDSIRDLLEIEGYEAHGAENGKRALEILHLLKPPCLVLLDLMMPVMNGWEFMRIKQESLELAPIPVVVLSAVADRAQMEIPASRFLKKPIDLERLLQVVKEHCS